MAPALNLFPKESLPAMWSAWAVYGLALALPVALVVIGLVRWALNRRRATAADGKFDRAQPLEAGPAVLHGKVELDPAHDCAIRVTVRQFGSESKHKNSWTHRWEEVKREIEVAPFYVHDQRGERVRVEPDTDVLLADRADVTRDLSQTERLRIATLSHDEVAYVVGQLEFGVDPGQQNYRGRGAPSLVMRRTRTEPLLVSTLPLGERYRRRAKVAGWLALALVAYMALMQLIGLGYHLRQMEGRAEIAKVTSAEKTTGKNARCVLTLALDDGRYISDSLASSYCAEIPVGTRMAVFVVPTALEVSQLGSEPTINVGFAAMAVFVFLFILATLGRPSRVWYEGRNLVETGAGRLRTFTTADDVVTPPR